MGNEEARDNPFDVSFTPCFSRIDGPVKEIPILRALDRFPARQAADGYFSEEPRARLVNANANGNSKFAYYTSGTRLHRGGFVTRAAGIREPHVRAAISRSVCIVSR